MFGFGKNKSGDSEEDEKRIEALKLSIVTAVEHLRAHARVPTPDRAEPAAKRIQEMLKNPKVPPEFRKDAQDAADKLQRECFMKAADEAGRAALKAAMSGDNDARNESVKKTRDYLGKAMSLKAPKEFKMACDRVLDIAQMTGGIKSDKPTKAKPQMTKAEVESKEAAKHKLDEPKEGAEIPVKGKAEKDLKNLTNA
ncbi:MAG: hypothetical protein HOL85_02525 [Rhodospirillaceae bacterium]|jgi:hypothetical protein|nr:hypothetical protein [Rhodospirillaceae bacterium]MBT6138663.1 hypothetical protein [Rhodospirillaceae bacterium]